MPSYCLTLSGTNLPPKQCCPVKDSLHRLGKPREMRYFGVKSLWMLPQFASHPLGMSTDSTFSWKGPSYSRKSLQGCLIQPVKGKPKMASIMRDRSVRCYRYAERPMGGWKDSGVRTGIPLRVHSCRQFPFLPSSSLKTTRSTVQRIILRCLAATSPSPPLFPGPTRTHTLWPSGGMLGGRCWERMRFASCATAIPAISMRVSEGKRYLPIRVSSSSLLSSLLPKVIFFIIWILQMHGLFAKGVITDYQYCIFVIAKLF